MKRRRNGNKKTVRDEKNHPSLTKKVIKVGAVAAGIAYGSYSFLNSDFGKELIDSKVISTAAKTAKNFKKDLLNKPKDLRTLKSAYDKNIGKNGKIFKRELAKRQKEKHDFSNTDIINKMHSIKQTRDRLFRNAMKNEHGSAQKDFLKATLDNLKNVSEKDSKAIEDFINATYMNVTKKNAEDGSMNKYVEKHIQNFAKNKKDPQAVADQLQGLLVRMAEYKEDLNITTQDVYDKYKEAANEAVDYRLNTLTNNDKNKVSNFFDKVLETVTGTKAATLKDLSDLDLLDNTEFGQRRIKHFIKEEGMNSLDEVVDYNKLIKQYSSNDRFRDLVIDNSIRIGTDKDGNTVLRDFSGFTNSIENLVNKVNETLPGKILLKGHDLGHKETLAFLTTGKKDINAYLTGSTDNILQNMMMYADGTLFNTKEIDGKIHIDFDSAQESEIVTGWRKKITHDILGTNQHPAEAYDNFWARLLDINQDGESNILQNFKRVINKTNDPNWEKNALQHTKDFYLDSESIGPQGYNTIESRIAKVTQDIGETAYIPFTDNAIPRTRLHRNDWITSVMMNKQITGVSDELMQTIIEQGELSDKQKHLMELLLNGSENDINQFFFDIMTNDKGGNVQPKDFKNFRLAEYVNMMLTDSEKVKDISHVSLKEGNPIPFFDIAIDEKYQRDILGQLRVEMTKEIMLDKNAAMNKSDSKLTFLDWLDKMNVNVEQRNELENIGLLGIFEEATGMQEGKYAKNVAEKYLIGGTEDEFNFLLQENSRMRNLFSDKMDGLINSFNIKTKGYTGGFNETDLYDEYSGVSIVKKSNFSPNNILETINGLIKGEASGDDVKETIFNGIKELNGGRNRPEDVSGLTLGLQYSISRINYGLQEVGLGLSENSMSSPLQTYLSYATKRVLPIMAGVGALSYLNDETRHFTGTSLSEIGARSLSRMDMGARSVLYHTPIGDKINSWAQSSVIHEYYFGDNKFDTSEEREEWYENGYSPVRKGRWWSFGSASEYRGGDISYFQPNYLRRAESNYHDISVYGSSEEKWAHSWIPTPTHPLSTIRAALNPYWLEKKHLKEGDRPYPMTGKLFSEGTAWGAVLNPTVGEILKPVRMLPDVQRRLGNDGTDIVATLGRINEKIKRKNGDDNDSLIIANGTDIRNGTYIPYGNPADNELNVTINNGQVEVPGFGYMDKIDEFKNYEAPNGSDYVTSVNGNQTMTVAGTSAQGMTIYTKGQEFANNLTRGLTNRDSDKEVKNIAQTMVSNINNMIKRGNSGTRNMSAINNGPNRENSTFIFNNRVNEWNNYTKDYYAMYQNPSIINNSRIGDFAQDIRRSNSQIAGMYGFLTGVAMDSNSNYSYRWENAGQMSSFTRTFWDANIGGAGGGAMEIARRFFPSTDKNRIGINPLVNNMPDWMPDNYKTGDPYTKVPKGEMRLPGKGYESLYELHPDNFGDYGAFDRFKILADIAPNSAEYKTWKNIASNTVTDTSLIQEMNEIKKRVSKMSGHHEFFDYKYSNNKTKYVNGTIKSVNNGVITLLDNTKLSLAGVNVTQQTDQALEDMIGKEIVYQTSKTKTLDKDEYGNLNKNRTQAAVLYQKGNKTSLNKILLDQGAVEENPEDNSALGQIAKLSSLQTQWGALEEKIAHAPIPIIHNKFLKVETAYESYMNETYYGSSFQTWDHPIRAFVKPMINQQSGKSFLNEAASLGIAYTHFNKVLGHTTDKKLKLLSNIALATSNPTAFLGGNIAYALHLSNGAIGKGQELTRWQKGAKIGTILGTAKWAWDNADNPLKSTATMAAVGGYVMSKDFGWEVAEKIIGKAGLGKGVAIGAGIGLGMSMIKNPTFDKEKMFGKWAPKETRKKWELDEYFDRLEYIKYEGLYQAAAKRASFWEGTDIKKVFKQIDKNKKEIAKLNVKEQKMIRKQKEGDDKYAHEIEKIEQRKMLLSEQQQMFFKGGKYTQAAIAYKKKAESTMYGLSGAATKDELLAAVPDQYKDHFTAFMDVTDKKEQKKILKSVSPMMRRPLQAAWGLKVDKPQSNLVYFHEHAMPFSSWKGWKPNVNLRHVKMKTIQNEGMLLSDFGFYESETAEAQYEMAPEIEGYDKPSGALYALSLKKKLRGSGLRVDNISVDRTSAPGVRVIGNIQEDIHSVKKVGKYGVTGLAYKLGRLI